jgi:CubicO group peptidase (beta-lactamase class C family)
MRQNRILDEPMKTRIALAICSSRAALAAGPFVIDKADPEAGGMSAARLARIPARIKEFVDAGKTAGVVTLMARHGHLASLNAVGYQNLEGKTPMRPDTIFRLASVTKRPPARTSWFWW